MRIKKDITKTIKNEYLFIFNKEELTFHTSLLQIGDQQIITDYLLQINNRKDKNLTMFKCILTSNQAVDFNMRLDDRPETVLLRISAEGVLYEVISLTPTMQNEESKTI